MNFHYSSCLLDSYPDPMALHRMIIENFDGGILVADANGTIIFQSGPGEFFLGIPMDKLVGKNINYLIEEGLNTKPVTVDVLRYKIPAMRYFVGGKSGTWQFAMARPVFDDKGELVFVVTYTFSDLALNEITKKYVEEKENKQQLLEYFMKPSITPTKFIAESSAMKHAMSTLLQVAGADTSVLLMGESGCGKEVFAHLLHENSARSGKNLIPINCASIPESLMETELFGYEPGAYTGASSSGKRGLFELAADGTIFLDEIGEMPLSMQGKLLRVLESGEFRKVGGTKTLTSNARVVAATNRDLYGLVKEKQFRADLYYRLSIVPITIPPLRERREDILPLAEYFLNMYNAKHHTEKIFARETEEYLLHYDWPGNVRELRNVIERMILITSGLHLLPVALGITFENNKITSAVQDESIIMDSEDGDLRKAVNDFEQKYIQAAYKKMNNNVAETAKYLKIPVSTLYQKLRQSRVYCN